MSEIVKSAEGKNFTAVNFGKLNQVSEYTIEIPGAGENIRGKVFLKDITGASGTEISYNVLPPQTGIPFLHTHTKNEETYLILTGNGKFQVDEEYFEISEGSVIRVAPAGKRGMYNNADEPMHYIVIQSKAGSLEEYTVTDGSILETAPKW